MLHKSFAQRAFHFGCQQNHNGSLPKMAYCKQMLGLLALSTTYWNAMKQISNVSRERERESELVSQPNTVCAECKTHFKSGIKRIFIRLLRASLDEERTKQIKNNLTSHISDL